MRRLLLQSLIEWKNGENRKPLILKGVRQCGKTYLVTTGLPVTAPSWTFLCNTGRKLYPLKSSLTWMRKQNPLRNTEKVRAEVFCKNLYAFRHKWQGGFEYPSISDCTVGKLSFISYAACTFVGGYSLVAISQFLLVSISFSIGFLQPAGVWITKSYG